MTQRVEVLADGVACILGDCREIIPVLPEILPTFPKVDAVVTGSALWGLSLLEARAGREYAPLNDA